jgi:hypothetical protein
MLVLIEVERSEARWAGHSAEQMVVSLGSLRVHKLVDEMETYLAGERVLHWAEM